MKLVVAGVVVLAAIAAGPGAPQTPPAARGVALADLAWPDAEPWLTASTVVVIPLGAGAVEQGPHMKLNSGERLARHLTARVQAASAVVVAPMLTYHAYAPYAAYPGSMSLGDTVARDLTVDAVRSLAAFGPRRFYVLNTSSAPIGALQAASRTLADAGILFGYTDPGYWTKRTGLLKQSPTDVGHADEAFTSMMLFVDPASVDMTRAAREYPVGRGALTRVEGGRGRVSPSGVIGDATLATAPKGRALVEALAAGMLEDIESIRQAPLPVARATAAPPAPAPRPRPPLQEAPRGPGGCSEADIRAIRQVGGQFTYYWAQLDAQGIAKLFAEGGDIRHPDGSIERGYETIVMNRIRLFQRSDYAGSKHPVDILPDVRCLDSDIAIADGKWELRLRNDPSQTPGRGLGTVKNNAGWCTLVMVKRDADWLIQAWRYTVDPPPGAPPPVLLSKPGFTGRGGL